MKMEIAQFIVDLHKLHLNPNFFYEIFIGEDKPIIAVYICF